MSLTFQYLMMAAFLLESFNVFFITIHKSNSLHVKSKIKVSLYSLQKFIKESVSLVILFLVITGIMSLFHPILILYGIYLLFLPLIIPHTYRLSHLYLLVFAPLSIQWMSFHWMVIALFILLYSFFYQLNTHTVSFDSNFRITRITRVLLPLLFIIIFILQNFSHTLFQQVLIVGMFVLVMSLENSLAETKALLIASKNRYVIWNLKSNHFNLKFLNDKTRITLYQQLFMITYLSMFISLLSKNGWMFIIIGSACIYLLLSELDKLIQYKFFNQSILYDDVVSRFIFSQIMLSGISFYLLYLGCIEVMHLNNIHLPYFSFIKFVFLVWYSTWIYFFYKRFDKKIPFKILKVISLVTLFSLTACSSKEVESFMITEESITFTGNMVHLNKQEFNLDEDNNTTLSVGHGDSVKKGDVLFSMYDPDSNNEIKRINFQINQINEQINELNQQISKSDDDIFKSDLKGQISSYKHDIELLNFDKNLIHTTQTHTAKFDGQVYLKDGLLKVYSKTLVLNLELNEHEYRKFTEFKSYNIKTLDHETITKSKNYIIHFVEDAYVIAFDVFEYDCYVNQTLLVEPSSPLLFVPEDFVRKDDKQLLVSTEATEVIIKANYDELKKGYYIKEGLKAGDVIYRYE